MSAERLARAKELTAALRRRLFERIVGHAEAVDLVLTALFAGGHALLEGVPGIGKTLLVRTLADAIDATFQRIQFTPDLMPADVTGTTILYEAPGGAREFRFHRGPIFANVLLADEINRATPKTQAAMLEAMEERQVTSGGETRPLGPPFLVLATQNPIEMEGTYPLPEAQLDRFLYRIDIGSPTQAELSEIIDRATKGAPPPRGAPVTNAAEVASLVALTREVVITSDIRALVARIVLATQPTNREAPESVRRFLRYGASPRGALAIALGLQARALMEGRAHAERSDLPALLKPALRHRIALNFEGEAEGLTPDRILDDVSKSIPLR